MGLNKSDTVMRIDYAASATVDQSQFAQTLTAYGTGGYLIASAFTAIDGSGEGREYSVEFKGTSTRSGILIYHGNDAGSAIGFQARVASAVITITDSNGTVGTIAMPSHGAPALTYRLFVCTRPNPLTTGASDAHITEAMVHNTTGSTAAYYEIEQWTHAVGVMDAAENFSYGGRWNVTYLADNYGPGVGIDDCRVGRRFKSTTESQIDWGAITPASPTAGENQAAPFMAIDSGSLFGDGGYPAGPTYAFAGAQVRDSARRLAGYVVNMQSMLPAAHGRSNIVGATANSANDVTLTQVNETGGASPGFGNGPSGYPEICREFGDTAAGAFEYAGVPGFISTIQSASSTICAWVRWDSSAATGVIAGLTGGGTILSNTLNDCAVLSILTGGELQISWHHGNGSSYTLATTTTLTSGEWTFVGAVCTVNGANLDVGLWINTVKEVTGSGTLPTGGSLSTWQVGRRLVGAAISEPFEGAICEYMISDNALSDNDMLFLALRGQGYLKQENELVHWQFRQPTDGYMPARAFIPIDIDGATYRAHLDCTYRRFTNQMCGRFRARILTETVYTDPPGGVETEDTVKVAIVASSKKPGALIWPPELSETTSDTATLSASTRAWVEFDDLKIPRDAEGRTWFYVASMIADNSPTGHTAIKILGVQIMPYSKTISSGFPLAWQEP